MSQLVCILSRIIFLTKLNLSVKLTQNVPPRVSLRARSHTQDATCRLMKNILARAEVSELRDKGGRGTGNGAWTYHRQLALSANTPPTSGPTMLRR